MTRGKKWTKEEVDFLKKHYPKHGAKYCSEKLNKNRTSITTKAYTLKIKYKFNFWTKKDDSFLIKNYSSRGRKYCAEKLNRTKGAVKSRAKRLDIQAVQQLWTKEEDEIIKKYYQLESNKDLQKRLPDRTTQAISTRAKILEIPSSKTKYSISNQTLSYNENFFSEINYDSAYWAGFICGDGTLNSSGNNLVIMLAEQDKCILESFKNQINYTGTIKTYPMIGKCTQKRIKIGLSHAQKVIKDLNNIWNIPSDNKRYTTKPPQGLDFKHKLAYIIGLIDADGSIFYTKSYKQNKLLGIALTGTKEITTWFGDTLRNITDAKLTPCYDKKTICTYNVSATGKKALKIIERLKEIPTTFRLSRKWNKPDYSKPNPAYCRTDK